MTREPHIVTPAHDPARRMPLPDTGTAAWWREWHRATGGKKPDWWDRVFAEPFHVEQEPSHDRVP